MKLTTIKSAKFTLMALVLLNVMSCNTNDDEPFQENKPYYQISQYRGITKIT